MGWKCVVLFLLLRVGVGLLLVSAGSELKDFVGIHVKFEGYKWLELPVALREGDCRLTPDGRCLRHVYGKSVCNDEKFVGNSLVLASEGFNYRLTEDRGEKGMMLICWDTGDVEVKRDNAELILKKNEFRMRIKTSKTVHNFSWDDFCIAVDDNNRRSLYEELYPFVWPLLAKERLNNEVVVVKLTGDDPTGFSGEWRIAVPRGLLKEDDPNPVLIQFTFGWWLTNRCRLHPVGKVNDKYDVEVFRVVYIRKSNSFVLRSAVSGGREVAGETCVGRIFVDKSHLVDEENGSGVRLIQTASYLFEMHTDKPLDEELPFALPSQPKAISRTCSSSPSTSSIPVRSQSSSLTNHKNPTSPRNSLSVFHRPKPTRH